MQNWTQNALERFDNQHEFERMCADILNGYGYHDVVLIAPRGGSDGGRDITFHFETDKDGLACVTLRKDVKKKFKEDFHQRKAGDYKKYYFFCNSYITRQQKDAFVKYCSEQLNAELVVRDLEALRSELDSQFVEFRNKYLNNPLLQSNLVYDSTTEQPPFNSWIFYNRKGAPNEFRIFQRDLKDSSPIVEIKALNNGSIGINKSLPSRIGRVEFEYKIISSSSTEMNIVFYMIPMKQQGLDLFEIPSSDRIKQRQVFIPPQKHIGDNCWHKKSILYDFRDLSEFIHTIFAPRINEGRVGKGPGCVLISNVKSFD